MLDKDTKPSTWVEQNIREHGAVETVCRAIRLGNDDIFWEALSRLDVINTLNKQGNPITFVAAWNGKLDYLIGLINKGSDVSILSSSNDNILIFAARHSNITKYLLNECSNLDASHKNSDGFNPIMQATNIMEEGLPNIDSVPDRLKVIEMLISKGADIDAINAYGRTATMSACYSGSDALVEGILTYNPDLSIRCFSGKTAIDYSLSPSIEDLLRKHLVKPVRMGN